MCFWPKCLGNASSLFCFLKFLFNTDSAVVPLFCASSFGFISEAVATATHPTHALAILLTLASCSLILYPGHQSVLLLLCRHFLEAYLTTGTVALWLAAVLACGVPRAARRPSRAPAARTTAARHRTRYGQRLAAHGRLRAHA